MSSSQISRMSLTHSTINQTYITWRLPRYIRFLSEITPILRIISMFDDNVLMTIITNRLYHLCILCSLLEI